MTNNQLLKYFKEFIEILTKYDIVHNEFPTNYVKEKDQLYGLCCDDMSKIFIFSRACSYYKRRTVVHELLHAVHHASGDQDFFDSDCVAVECKIEEETNSIMELLYGKKEQIEDEKKILKRKKERDKKDVDVILGGD